MPNISIVYIAKPEVRSVKGALDAMRSGNNAIVESIMSSQRSSEPTLPPKKIIDEDGVSIEHYTRSGDHAPAHLHVKGKGVEVRIGQNGKPLKGNSELSAAQKEVVEKNLPKIRSAVKKIQKWHKNVIDK